MAAAARPPGLGDARVPCPLCGGLIHPVAGRCKHCKEDLSSFRAGRPQAATPLPSLVTPVPGSIAQAVAAPAAAEGHGTAIPVTIPTAREGSQPILPPRPTSQWRMKAQKPRGWLRHWPMITIVLAVIAMLVAVVIMVLPQSDKHDGKKKLMAPPAPDRMNTDPLGRQSQVDPWGDPDQRPQPQAAPDPDDQAQNAPAPRQMPDPPKAPPAQDPDDLFGGLSGGSGGGGTFGGALSSGTGGFMLTMVNRACKKLQSCPSSSGSTLTAVCDGINAMPLPPMPSASSCPHAQKCLDAIDKLDCNAQLDDPFAAVSLIRDCSNATDC